MTMIIDGTNGITFNNSTVQASAGSVLQIVHGSYSTNTSTTSTSYSDTGLSLAITPKFSTSKILVLVAQASWIYNPSGASGANYRIVRNSTVIQTLEANVLYNSVAGEINAMQTFVYLDSPATTSATTYKMQQASYSSGWTTASQTNNMPSTMTLMEIAG